MTRPWTGPPLPPHWAAAGAAGFVGRDPQIATIREAWRAAVEGTRQVLLIGGDGGVGKSRLVIETVTECAASGAAVLVGGCVPELGSPYQPFTEPVERLLADAVIGEVPQSEPAPPGDGSRTERLTVLAGRGPAAPAVAAAREYKPQLYGALVQALRSRADARPVVLVLEDVHWAAPDGLQLLHYVVEHTADIPLLLLVTHRTIPADRSPALVRALAAMQRVEGVQRIELTPLAVGDIAELLVLEGRVPGPRAPALAAALLRHTGGNPFFLREVLRDADQHGGPESLLSDAVRAPASVRDTIQARLDPLPDDARHILELAAVLGEEIDPALLRLVDVASGTPVGTEGLLSALDGAVAVGLLETVAPPAGPYRFPHSLARQGVLDLVPPSRLCRWHAAAAQVLEERPDEDRRVQRLAHHYASARALGHGERAVHYLVESARIADRALAHEEAAELFQRAASLAGRAEQRDGLHLAAARSHVLAGDPRRAAELDLLVLEHGRPRDRLRAAIGFESASWRTGQPGHRAVELLTGALPAADGDTTDPMYVRGVAALARAYAFTGAVDRAAALAERAIELARALGQEQLLGRTLQTGLHVGVGPRNHAIRLQRARELSELAERTGDLGQLCVAAYHRGVIGYLKGHRREVDDAHVDMLKGARTTGQPFWEYLAGGFDYARWFAAGNFAAAERAAAEQARRGMAMQAAENAEGPFAVQTYMVRRESGTLHRVRPLISGTESPTEHWAPGLLALYTEFGLADQAHRILRWILDRGLERYEVSADWPTTLVFLTEAALRLGDAESARQLRPRLGTFEGLNIVADPFIAVFGSADRYLGGVDSLLGRRGAGTWFESALDMDTRMEAPLHQAHTLAAQLVHLRRIGAPPRDLRTVLGRVRELAEPAGMHRVLRMVEAVPGPGPAEAGPDGLTPRELEVLRLLAAGSSNRDIARRLVISESTAANHVRSIMMKTGTANRTQAARYATSRELVE